MDMLNNIGQSEQTQSTANLNDIDSSRVSTAELEGAQELGYISVNQG